MSETKSPVTWLCKVKKTWSPYPPVVSQILESEFSKKQSSCTLSGLLGDGEAYTFDFVKFLQINTETGFERKIKREGDVKVKITSPIWSCLVKKQWKPYDPMTCKLFESEYTKGIPSFTFKDAMMPQNGISYTIDFTKMKQINNQSGFSRDIRRETDKTRGEVDYISPSVMRRMKLEVGLERKLSMDLSLFKVDVGKCLIKTEILIDYHFFSEERLSIKDSNFTLNLEGNFPYAYFCLLACALRPLCVDVKTVKSMFIFMSDLGRIQEKLKISNPMHCEIMAHVLTFDEHLSGYLSYKKKTNLKIEQPQTEQFFQQACEAYYKQYNNIQNNNKGTMLFVHVKNAKNLAIGLRDLNELAPYCEVTVTDKKTTCTQKSKIPIRNPGPVWSCMVQKKWQPYSPAICKILEETYAKGTPSYTLKGLVDGDPDTLYTIDFSRMVQINLSTKHERNVLHGSLGLGPNPLWDDFLLFDLSSFNPENTEITLNLLNFSKLNQSFFKTSLTLSDIKQKTQLHLPMTGKWDFKQGSQLSVDMYCYARGEGHEGEPPQSVREFLEKINVWWCYQILVEVIGPGTPYETILNDFVKIFGISPYVFELLNLEKLSVPLNPVHDKIGQVIEILEKLEKQDKSLWSKKELGKYADVCNQIITQIKYIFVNFVYYTEKVLNLNDTKALLRCAEIIIGSEMNHFLSGCFKAAAENSYHIIKKILQQENQISTIIKSLPYLKNTLVNTLVVPSSHFEGYSVFPKTIFAMTYHIQLNQDILQLDKDPGPHQSMFQLATACTQMIEFLKTEAEQSGTMDITAGSLFRVPVELFQGWTEKWVDSALENLRNCMERSLEAETWEPNKKVCYTNSMTTITDAIRLQLDNLALVKHNRSQHISIYVTKSCAILTQYLCQLKETCLKTLQTQSNKVPWTELKLGLEVLGVLTAGNQNRATMALTVSSQLCGQISNILAMQKFIVAFQDNVREIIDGNTYNLLDEKSFQPFFVNLGDCSNAIIIVITEKIKIDTEQTFQWLVNPSETIDDRDGPFFTYMDYQIGKFYINLDQIVFQKILEAILQMLEAAIYHILKEYVSKKHISRKVLSSQELVTLLNDFCKDISTWFYAEGNGLSKESIEKTIHDLCVLIEFWCAPTESIIAAYLKDPPVYEISKKQIIQILKRRKEDNQAIEFLKTHNKRKATSPQNKSEKIISTQKPKVGGESKPDKCIVS